MTSLNPTTRRTADAFARIIDRADTSPAPRPFQSIIAAPWDRHLAVDVMAWAVRMARANHCERRLAVMSPANANGDATPMPGDMNDIVQTLIDWERQYDQARPLPADFAVRRVPFVDRLADDDFPGPRLFILPVTTRNNGLRRLSDALRQLLKRPGVGLMLVRQHEMQRIRSIATCIESIRRARRAVDQAARLVRTYSLNLKILHPSTLAAMDLCALACGDSPCCGRPHPRVDPNGRCRSDHRVPPGTCPGAAASGLVSRDVPNWDGNTRLSAMIRDEHADLIILPLRHRIWFPVTRFYNVVRTAIDATGSNLLFVR